MGDCRQSGTGESHCGHYDPDTPCWWCEQRWPEPLDLEP